MSASASQAERDRGLAQTVCHREGFLMVCERRLDGALSICVGHDRRESGVWDAQEASPHCGFGNFIRGAVLRPGLSFASEVPTIRSKI